jgi:hypothetical protein
MEQKPVARDLSKQELRAILCNPSIDTSKPGWETGARLMPKRDFQREVYAVVQTHCAHIITLEDFKRKHIVKRKVIDIIFQQLL